MLLTRRQSDKLLPPHFNFALFSTLYGVYTEFWTHPSEEEIITVFQLVKALADFPNTVYVLAFDYDVVVHALSKVQYGDGKEYLEKIIQVPFEIPAPSIANIHEALFSKLNSILGEIPEERWAKTTWAELFQFGLQKYIKSIRDVIRYTNLTNPRTRHINGRMPFDTLTTFRLVHSEVVSAVGRTFSP